MLFYNIYLCILLHVVVLSKSEKVNISLSKHLDRQNKLFSILYHVHQTNCSKDVTEIASGWSLEEHKADFTGLLPKEQAFTPFYESHLEEAIALFRLFFYAKDWDAFYKTLTWARKNVNSQMLIYALFLAVDHRKDCKSLVVPPIYEVYPHLFVDGLTVREVGRKKTKFDQSFTDTRSKHDLELLEHDPDKHKYHRGKVPGVKIKSVDVGGFVKNTEFSEIDMINTFNHTESEKFGDFQVRLRLMRPKPDNFSYTIHVESETATKLCFKHRMNMFNLDKFTYNLKRGQNTIERNITQSPYFTSDERSFSEMYREILSALAGNTSYKAETFDPTNTYAWPLRFFVAAFQENDTDDGPLAMLYPFDRPIKNEKMFQKVPNFYSHTVSVEPHPCSGFMDRPSDCNKQ
ncbi:unnamed protein product [Callosobruchus maculatus]|uniref:Hemocyanin C-terminal domain-containing protein n=1 Tax=Callosobruchus maculatus TaxID=64391 RepID=A0A653CIW0_CALMS|nr:unnamed protein product [Callosobruchus maculatus]